MSVLKDILTALKATIELNGKVVAVANEVSTLAKEMREFDRRLVRIETIIEIAKPDGSVLRIAPPSSDPKAR